MKYIYDFLYADGREALKAVIGILNAASYELVSVAQYEHTYTVFFRRRADA